MPLKPALGLLALLVVAPVLGRERWLERDSKPVFLHPRRFGQQNPPVLVQLGQACPGQICGVLSGEAVAPLLANAPECTQQDTADKIIDESRQFDNATQANMIALAIEYRKAEKNTPPDFTTNPPSLRNSIFCQKAPRNGELVGLVQAQDPANDPNLFFDPAYGKTVRKGEQQNTLPFCTKGSASDSTAENTTTKCTASAPSGLGNFDSCSVPEIEFGDGFDGRKETSFRAIDRESYPHGSAQNIGVITQFICDSLINTCKADQTAKNTCFKAKATADTAPQKTGAQADAFNAVFGKTSNFTNVPVVDDTGHVISGSSTSTSKPNNSTGNFGKCSVPKIEFGVGFDGRKETSFQPVDKSSYNHGSAQNIDVITQFICDRLRDTCGADQTTQDNCARATTASDSAAIKTGAQADAFNNVFGIKTNFASVSVVDDTGHVVSGEGSTPSPNTQSPGSFGKCSVPKIEFGDGFDGRKETSFRPADPSSYDHGSAQNIDIIAQFVCDRLRDTCGADDIAQNNCVKASAAADAKPAKTGAQADAFNAIFGVQTNFASQPVIDDHGNVVTNLNG